MAGNMRGKKERQKQTKEQGEVFVMAVRTGPKQPEKNFPEGSR